MFLSLDDTLSPGLTGAVFATQSAIDGFLLPGGSAAAPTLDMELASAHLSADGSPTRGTLQAFLPESALLDLYGVLPGDGRSFFQTTRTGDPGTSDPPVFTPRAASNLDDPGLMITVTNISFSAPTYRVSRRAATLHARLVRRNRRVSVTSAAVAACRWHRCTATVYRLDGTYTGRAQVIGSAHSDSHGATLVRLTAAKLPRGVTYLVLVRRGHQLVAGTRGKA